MRIRGARLDDAPGMIAVVNAAFAVEDFIDGTRTDEDRLAEMMQKGEFLVAEDAAGKISACVYMEQQGERGYFGMLAVDPSQQGAGLGRLLIDAAESHCHMKGSQWMDIRVLTLRPELLPFYERLGYRETRRVEFRPSRPLKKGFECECIIMSKKL